MPLVKKDDYSWEQHLYCMVFTALLTTMGPTQQFKQDLSGMTHLKYEAPATLSTYFSMTHSILNSNIPTKK
jgi:hypothetical protein